MNQNYRQDDYEDDSLLNDTVTMNISIPSNVLNSNLSGSNSNGFGGVENAAGGGDGGGAAGVSPLEQEVLDEYERLLKNMQALSSTLATLSGGPMTLEIAEGLRLLERKCASVYTLMKASVYSIVLQQGQGYDED